MANNEQVIYVNVNTEGAKTATEELEKELLVLRLALGKLKAAIINAVAPIGAVLVPVLQNAVWAATRLVNAVGKVIAALLGYNTAAKTTIKTQKKLTKTNDDAKRSLMGFDEINRLTEGPVGWEETVLAGSSTLTPQLENLVSGIQSILAPLQQIDFTPAVTAFGSLRLAMESIGQNTFAGLQWGWFNLLVPLTKWTIEDLLPEFLRTLASLLGVLDAVIVALQPGAEWLLESFLKPLAQWTGEKIINALGWLREKLDGISQWVAQHPELTQKILVAAAAIATVCGVLGKLNSALGGMTNPLGLVGVGVSALIGILGLLVAAWQGVKTVAAGVWSGIQTAWGTAGSWFQKNIFSPISNGFRGMVNGIIGFLNGLASGAVAVVNSIVGAVNNLAFTIPSWVPGVGGKSIGFQLKTASAPQIPYLAQGAVLPANKPFLAVVGDQKHGTNVEAPLATIQQAVATVMGDQTSAILAGFATSVEVQREILQAVLGIQIGDDVIGSAMCRYRQKMAVVNGGME